MTSILTVKEVALKLRMSPSTIYKYAENGIIPSFKIGTSLRFFEEVVDVYLHGLVKK